MARGVVWFNGLVGLALVTRSGSHTMFKKILNEFYPDNRQQELNITSHDNTPWHPVKNLSHLYDTRQNAEVLENPIAVLVRDPVERFRSACARQNKSVDEAITSMNDDVHFWTLESMGLLQSHLRHFVFPEQLSECAEYLKLSPQIPRLNAEGEKKKPLLTAYELLKIQKAYDEDIQFYKKLKGERL